MTTVTRVRRFIWGLPLGSLACRLSVLAERGPVNALGAKTTHRGPVAPKHGLAVCGYVDPTRVPPAESFHGKESPLTREYARPIGALERFPCDTGEADVADVRRCGIRVPAQRGVKRPSRPSSPAPSIRAARRPARSRPSRPRSPWRPS